MNVQCEDCQDSKVCQHCAGQGDDPNGPPGANCPICDGDGICPYCPQDAEHKTAPVDGRARQQAAMVEWATEQLGRGLLPSVLPGHLMVKFQLTAAQARHVAEKAVKHRQVS